MHLDELTVIVPTRNEAHNIAAFLGSLPVGVRLIVVDSSLDDTLSIVRRLRPKNTVGLALAGNIAAARQAGTEEAHTR